MKEIENHQPDDLSTNNAEVRKEVQKIKVGELKKIHAGHNFYEVSIHTLEAKKLELPKSISFDGKDMGSQLPYDPNMFYTTATNERNAIWHFARSLGIKKKDFDRWLTVKREALKELAEIRKIPIEIISIEKQDNGFVKSIVKIQGKSFTRTAKENNTMLVWLSNEEEEPPIIDFSLLKMLEKVHKVWVLENKSKYNEMLGNVKGSAE